MMSFKPPAYLLASLAMSLGGFINGFDTGAIGALTTMDSFVATFGALEPTKRGLIISTLLLTGALPAFYAGRLADRYGSEHVVMLGALVFALGAVLQGAARALPMLIVGRAFAGLGEGLFLSNVSAYITEIAPTARRGALVSITQLMTIVGISAGFFACLGSEHIGSSVAWRLPFIVMAAAAAVLAAACRAVPASPRWLFLHGRADEAVRAIERLQIPRAEAENTILRPPTHAERAGGAGVLFVFTRPHRARTLLALFLLGMAQLSGIDGVLYYAPLLFAQAGLSAGKATFLASGVSSLAMLAVTVPALLLADRVGRRTSVLAGGAGMAACMFVMGALYASGSVHAGEGAARWVVVVLIFAFAMLYSSTWAISGRIYASEIQAPRARAAANSVAQGMGFLTNWLVALFTPVFLARSSYGAYFLFGSLALFTVGVCLLSMPETVGRSLEAIQESFQAPGLKALSWLTRRIGRCVGHDSSEVAATEGLHDRIDLVDREQETSAMPVRLELAAA